MTIEITLSKGYTAIIDDADKDLAEFKWHHVGGYVGRVTPVPERKAVFMHRVILERAIGRPLVSGEVCDHQDGNKFNNSRANLRVATISQNTVNSKPRNRQSGYRGVRPHSPLPKNKKWVAEIAVNKHRIKLGIFDTPEEAHAAYCEAAKKYHGEFARFD